MSHVAQPPAALRQLLWQQSLMKAWTGPLLFSPTQRTYHQPPTCISPHRVQVYSPSMLNVLQLTYSRTHKNTHVHFACIYTQVIDLFSQLLKEDELSKHSNADLHSLIIHKAAKLRDVNFINGEGGGGGHFMHHWEVSLPHTFNQNQEKNAGCRGMDGWRKRRQEARRIQCRGEGSYTEKMFKEKKYV